MRSNSYIRPTTERARCGFRGAAPLLFILASFLISACAAGTAVGDVQENRPRDGGARADTSGAPMAPYVESIPGTIVTFEMLPVPGGTITLNAPDGPREVAVGPFYMGKTEVTWDEYDVFVFGFNRDYAEEVDEEDALLRPSRPYGSPDFGFGRRGYPALAMSYVGAMAYAEWLSARTGRQYRVPTEAEWEYVCRAGFKGTPDENALPDQAWYWDNAWDKTHPVASLEPNGWGFYDMLGNAAEWCIGLDGEYYVCGGSWRQRVGDVNCGARMAQTDAWNATDPQIPKSLWWLSDGDFVGFRIVRDP